MPSLKKPVSGPDEKSTISGFFIINSFGFARPQNIL